MRQSPPPRAEGDFVRNDVMFEIKNVATIKPAIKMA
jgi:hypothetical protein